MNKTSLRRGDHVRMSDDPSIEGWVSEPLTGYGSVEVAWANGITEWVDPRLLDCRRTWRGGWRPVR